MISRRALVTRLPLVAAGGLALWLVRDRIPWPGPAMHFTAGRATPWIPLPPRNGLIEMPARVNGRPIRVVVDSGAQVSAIDRALAAELDLQKTVALPFVAYGVSGRPDVTHTVRLDLDLPGLAIPGLRAAALDIGRLSQITGRDFQMLIGRDVLRGLVLDADLPRDRARFLAPAAYRPPRDATIVPLTLTGAGPMTSITVDGARVQAMVDTGATGPLALSENAARAAGLLIPGHVHSSAPSVSLGGLSLDRIVAARTVELAGLSFRQMPVQVYAPWGGPVPPGLLGLGFLRRFRIALDLRGKRLYLTRPTLLLVPAP